MILRLAILSTTFAAFTSTAAGAVFAILALAHVH